MEPTKMNKLVISLVIVVLLVIGAIYLSQKNQKAIDQEIEKISEVDTTELESLEQDLNTLDTNTGVDLEAVQ